MPVQINEVIIKAVVDPRPSSKAGPNEPDCPPSSGQEGEIMEKLLDILREKQER